MKKRNYTLTNRCSRSKSSAAYADSIYEVYNLLNNMTQV